MKLATMSVVGGKTSLLAMVMTVGIMLVPSNSEAAPLNQDLLDHLNIQEWHDAGYTGEGVGILVEDVGRVDMEAPLLKDQVTPYNYSRGHEAGQRSSHAYHTTMTVRQFAPDADVHLITFDMSPIPAMPYNYLRDNHNISIMTKSLDTENLHGRFGPNGFPFRSYYEGMQKAYDRGVFLNAAAGNSGAEFISDHVREKEWFITGAASLFTGKPERKPYSSVGEGLLAMGATDVKVNDCMDTSCGSTYTFGGTSAATPVISSMAALYSQYFKEQVGRLPSPAEVKAFIISNTEDMETPGYDTNTGYGLFVLPENPKDTKLIILEEEKEDVELPAPPAVPDNGTNEDAVLPNFSDINNSWAKGLIREMAAKDIINGYPDKTFKPQKEIDRGQAAALFSRAIDLKPVRSPMDFEDVPKGHMYYEDIQAVYRAGIFDGTNENFRPGESLSRAQMAKIMTIAFDLESKGDANLSDVKGLWVEDYVNAMYTNGITTGNNGKFLPNKKVTREHYAAFLHRALEQSKTNQ